MYFFFTDPATTEIYTLSLHDALPIFMADFGQPQSHTEVPGAPTGKFTPPVDTAAKKDRKSTRLNSSHSSISYAVFCLKKKTKTDTTRLCHEKRSTRRKSAFAECSR